MYRFGSEYENIAQLAASVLIDYNIKKYPIDMFHLCEKMNILVMPYSKCLTNEEDVSFLIDKFPDGFCTFGKGRQPIIYYNDFLSNKVRVFSTLGHEIKHIINNDPDDLSDDLSNYFSKYIRCPLPFIMYLKCSSIEEISTKFNVSREQD